MIQSLNFLKITQELCPPNPNVLDRPARTSLFCALLKVKFIPGGPQGRHPRDGASPSGGVPPGNRGTQGLLPEARQAQAYRGKSAH